MSDFSWLYSGPTGPACKHCGDRINPCLKRTKWEHSNRRYVYLDPEVCDPCRNIHPVNDGPAVEEDSSESTSPSPQSWSTTALTYLASAPRAGRS